MAEQFFLKVAKEFGELTRDDFKQLPKVQYLLDTMKFFDSEGLLEFIKKEIENYEEFISNTVKISNQLKQEGSSIDQQICINDF